MSDYKQLNQPDQSSCPDHEELLCAEDEILEMLLALDTTKSSGPDGISATMLKRTILINISIRS